MRSVYFYHNFETMLCALYNDSFSYLCTSKIDKHYSSSLDTLKTAYYIMFRLTALQRCDNKNDYHLFLNDIR